MKWCRFISGMSNRPCRNRWRRCADFSACRCRAKQTAHVDIPVPVKELRYWDTARKQYVVEAGDYEILVGAASDDIRARLPLRIGGP